MLEAQIRNVRGPAIALLAAAVLSSCASQPPRTALVEDPDARAESSIPWNKPAKWESGANLPGGLGGTAAGIGSDPGSGY